MDLIAKKWYTVDQPWGTGSWIVAGNPDPHIGRPVCDCQIIDDEDDYDDYNFKSSHVAKHIVDLHNASLKIPQTKRCEV